MSCCPQMLGCPHHDTTTTNMTAMRVMTTMTTTTMTTTMMTTIRRKGLGQRRSADTNGEMTLMNDGGRFPAAVSSRRPRVESLSAASPFLLPPYHLHPLSRSPSQHNTPAHPRSPSASSLSSTNHLSVTGRRGVCFFLFSFPLFP